ncbi:HPr-rel-A system PqqD family peptide chaperone [Methylobacter sp. BBA5.1]|uniref:HPr-rel-A system PqqD family peptide chaperone n=1 Tax=Methylobacter sp. BBA5.1 TaxID=1495064 RepID=UPI0009DD8FFE|nr:HPr-rel-A system PqqD family peptide chaperone [Methylobacter sp. BBA5.1]
MNFLNPPGAGGSGDQPGAMRQEPVIRVPDNGRLLYRCWGDEYVFYHPATGDTHLFDQASADLILAVSAQPLSRAALLKRLAASLKSLTDQEIEQFLDELLMKCGQSGLLEVGEG